jgi:uncharacterized protein
MDDLAARRAQLQDIFTTLITAYGCKDFAGFAQHVHTDCLFDWPYLPLKEFPESVTGRDAFIEISKGGMADCDGYNHKVDVLYDMADPDMLIAEYHTSTILNSSGKPYGNKYLGILRFEGDQVVWWREYVNPMPIIEAFGLNFQNEAAAAA